MLFRNYILLLLLFLSTYSCGDSEPDELTDLVGVYELDKEVTEFNDGEVITREANEEGCIQGVFEIYCITYEFRDDFTLNFTYNSSAGLEPNTPPEGSFSFTEDKTAVIVCLDDCIEFVIINEFELMKTEDWGSRVFKQTLRKR